MTEERSLVERIAAQEINIQWITKEVNGLSQEIKYLRKEINRLRWELTGGVLILLAIQILLRLLT